MQTLQIVLPDFVSFRQRELQMMLAAKLYEQGTLSIGQAADVAEVSKRTFMELLGDYGVSVCNYAPSNLAEDVANA